MKAVVLKRFGGPDAMQVADVPKPMPAKGQVRIRVKASSVNRADLHPVSPKVIPPVVAPAVKPGKADLDFSHRLRKTG